MNIPIRIIKKLKIDPKTKVRNSGKQYYEMVSKRIRTEIRTAFSLLVSAADADCFTSEGSLCFLVCFNV